jgi:hypothetical protein
MRNKIPICAILDAKVTIVKNLAKAGRPSGALCAVVNEFPIITIGHDSVSPSRCDAALVSQSVLTENGAMAKPMINDAKYFLCPRSLGCWSCLWFRT